MAAPGAGGGGGIQPGLISGRAFLDQNADGVYDTSDVPFPGVTVTLYNTATNARVTSQQTDANGNYTFSGLTPTGYYAVFTAPSGSPAYIFSPPGGNPDPSLDSVVNSSGRTGNVTVTSAGAVTNQDAGTYQPVGYTIFVYADANANRVYEPPGDTGLSGVTVYLTNANASQTLQGTTTDGSGHAAFSGLTPGTYQIYVATVAGKRVTQSTNTMTPFTLTSGQVGQIVVGQAVNFVTGSLTVTEGGDSLSAVGTVVAGTGPDIMGVLNLTEQDDVVAAVGRNPVSVAPAAVQPVQEIPRPGGSDPASMFSWAMQMVAAFERSNQASQAQLQAILSKIG